jgi:hypothetical protein
LSGTTGGADALVMRFMTWFIRAAGLYNASAVIVFLTPGSLDALGVELPYPA